MKSVSIEYTRDDFSKRGLKSRVFMIFSFFLLTNCASAHDQQIPDIQDPHAALKQELQQLVNDTVEENRSDVTAEGERPAIYGAALYVDAPQLAFSWEGSAGYTDHTTKEIITSAHPVRIASNTKTFVAAAILRLWEDKRVNLDAPIGQYISPQHSQIIRAGGYQLDSITVRHLLTHTSGLFDYADSNNYERAFTGDPQRRWTRTDQLKAAMDWGKPYGIPGEVYRYSDTGYILLGEVVESVSGLSLGLAMRQLLKYDGIGLTSTWLETVEPKPEGSEIRAHQYLGTMDFYNHDPSFDLYGGGGLVSTVGDLGRFYRALFAGGVYDDPKTGDIMLTSIKATRGGPTAYGAFEQVPGTYRMGISVQEVEEYVVYGHGGYFGTYAAYVPDLDVAISLSITQHYVRAEKKALLREVILLLEKAGL